MDYFFCCCYNELGNPIFYNFSFSEVVLFQKDRKTIFFSLSPYSSEDMASSLGAVLSCSNPYTGEEHYISLDGGVDFFVS